MGNFRSKEMKNIIVLLIAQITLIGCLSKEIAPEIGSVDIKIMIGPLCPVEPCNRTVDDIRKVYESYTFTIKDTKTRKQVFEQKLAYNGTNGILKSPNMTVGEYELDINPKNIFTKQGFPKIFAIEKNKITELEISIDTGIR